MNLLVLTSRIGICFVCHTSILHILCHASGSKTVSPHNLLSCPDFLSLSLRGDPLFASSLSSHPLYKNPAHSLFSLILILTALYAVKKYPVEQG